MSSKPPLRGRMGVLCAAKLCTHAGMVTAKVVFLSNCSRLRHLKLTVRVCTISMQGPCIELLPERYRQIRCHVSPDIDVFHFLTCATTNIINDVKILEVSPKVVSKIDAIDRVAACSSPVSRLALQESHSRQTLYLSGKDPSLGCLRFVGSCT